MSHSNSVVKATITIAITTLIIICGAVSAIVGGAGFMSLTAALLHMAVGG